LNRRVLLVGLAVALPVVGLLVASLPRDPTRIDSPLIGRPAPPFRLTPLDGGAPLTLESLHGRAVVLNFWATWCVPCVAEHAAIAQAARESGAQIAFIGVVYEDQEPAVREFLRERGASYPMAMDPEGRTAIAYGVYGVPETFFLSADGIIRHKQTGLLTPERLAQLIAEVTRPAAGGAS
jgi:cytochrome c biogenesis protein CcmG, thiol:disulfide interchange protein DsbE